MRNPRQAYGFIRREFSPVTIESAESTADGLKVKLRVRTDFPVLPIEGWKLEATTFHPDGSVRQEHVIDLPELEPGEKTTVQIGLTAKPDLPVRLCVLTPDKLCTYVWSSQK